MRRIFTGLCVAALLGCDAPAPTTPTADVADIEQEIASMEGAIRFGGAAFGIGQAELPTGFSPLSFAFGAIATSNGHAKGAFRYRYESASGTVDFDGRVTCVTFDAVNRRAWVGGVVTRNGSTDATMQTSIHEVGDDVWFRVVDYGDAAGAPVDRTTVLGFKGAAGFETSADYCAGKPWPAADARTWPVAAGNILVVP